MATVRVAANREAQLEAITRRLVVAYEPEAVYLFGSAARGDAGPDSDFDLLIVVPDNADARRQGSRLAYEVMWDTGVAADVLVWRHSAFEARLPLKASLPATVRREGRLLYVGG